MDFDRRKAFVNFRRVDDKVIRVIITEIGEDAKVYRRETRRNSRCRIAGPTRLFKSTAMKTVVKILEAHSMIRQYFDEIQRNTHGDLFLTNV